MILDITPTVHAGLAVWPGDVAYSRTPAMSFAGGDRLELSAITTTLHLGAHADAPLHYSGDGATIAQRPLERYLGRCQVMRVDVPRGGTLTPDHLTGPITAPRVLFSTGTFPNPDVWNEDFAALTPQLVHHLADAGVVLVGIDTPSIDPMTSRAMPSHKAVLARDLAVLEGLVLTDVPDGTYTLVALPLKLADADASPVRAVLLPPEAM